MNEKYKGETSKEFKKRMLNQRAFYRLQSILGYQWARFFLLLGGRQAGKSYSVTDFYLRQWKKYGRPFYWIRLTESSSKKLLQNNAEKLIDPDLRRKYNLDIVTNGNNVYEVVKRDSKGKIREKKKMATVLAANTFYNDKGSGLFDKDFLNDPKMWYNIAVDEFQLEKNERRTFDVMYALVNQLENILRNTKERCRIIMLGNTLEEAADVLCAFNFVPEEYGRYKLKYKKAVIEYLEPTEAYKEMRKGSIADLLMPNASTFTNKIVQDYSLINKERLIEPNSVIKFSKNQDDWFTIWNGNIIAKYNKENKRIINMRPYLDGVFNPEVRDNIILRFDNRSFQYRNLITFKLFQKNLELLKPRK